MPCGPPEGTLREKTRPAKGCGTRAGFVHYRGPRSVAPASPRPLRVSTYGDAGRRGTQGCRPSGVLGPCGPRAPACAPLAVVAARGPDSGPRRAKRANPRAIFEPHKTRGPRLKIPAGQTRRGYGSKPTTGQAPSTNPSRELILS